jgi:4'-phosphopantetheinyl transferase
MVGVVVGRDVGVDVENIPASVPFDVVDRSFHPAERAAVRAASPAEQPARFAETWTLKEAYLKARGVGLLEELDRFSVGLSPPRLVTADDTSGWQLQAFTPTPSHRAALCVRGGDVASLRVTVRWDTE